ncbi:MAG TPA: putative cytokinetic ring protein SteA [Actinomycetota bacterium]|nr:putative cytokinetic ring protein SteA [Actinomycetota bacterium]
MRLAARGSARRVRRATSTARVDGRTKRLLTRIQPGDIAVIDHEDLDRVAAEGLVARGVGAVVNASPSITGRYPNLGPLLLVQAGIPLLDGVGRLLMSKVREGDDLRIEGDRVLLDGQLAGVGIRQSEASVLSAMDEARKRLAGQFDAFARNTVEYLQRERDLLFGGEGMPDLDLDLTHRHVLVVVRGTRYREDLAALRAYVRDVKPVLVGVDGGADALLEQGYRPDLIVGDMDSVSERALRSGAEIVLHAYPGGHAPGRARLEELDLPFKVIEGAGTSEDMAYLLGHEKGADLIVAVGSHGNLREFLDKGRGGMASTFLVRLRVGEILVDAKGVSRMYRGSVRGRDVALLVAAALFSMVAVVAVSQPLQLFLRQLLEMGRQVLFRIGELF